MPDISPEPPAKAVLCEALARHIQTVVEPANLHLEWREWRWMALSPPYTILVADSESGWRRLVLEADLMEAARRTTGSLVPAVLVRDPNSWLQIRRHKTGVHGWEIEERIFGVKIDAPPVRLPRYSHECPLTGWGEVFAADLGSVLARLHGGMASEQIRAQLEPRQVDWTKIESVVRHHARSDVLVRACQRTRAWDAARNEGRAVLHGDPHFHNLFASEDGRVSGVIDFEAAVLGDFHEDLMYLHSQGPRFAEIAMAAYAAEAGVSLDRGKVGRFHVRSAFEHFSWVLPDAPRFPRIVAWATESLQALAPEWIR